MFLFPFKMAKKYHPDVNKEADASKKFQEVSEAYEVGLVPIPGQK